MLYTLQKKNLSSFRIWNQIFHNCYRFCVPEHSFDTIFNPKIAIWGNPHLPMAAETKYTILILEEPI